MLCFCWIAVGCFCLLGEVQWQVTVWTTGCLVEPGVRTLFLRLQAAGSNGNRGARGSREHCLNSVAGCRNGQEQGCDLCLGNNTSRCGTPVVRERASKRTAGVLASLVTEDLSSLPRQGGCERACLAVPMILPLRLEKSCFGFTGRRFVYYDFKGFESSTTAWRKGSGWSPCETQWSTAT